MLFGGIVLLLGKAVPRYIEHALEFAVGVMLIVLGIDVLRRLVILRIHFHVHSHETGITHVHAHSRRRLDRAHGAAFSCDRHPSVLIRALTQVHKWMNALVGGLNCGLGGFIV